MQAKHTPDDEARIREEAGKLYAKGAYDLAYLKYLTIEDASACQELRQMTERIGQVRCADELEKGDLRAALGACSEMGYVAGFQDVAIAAIGVKGAKDWEVVVTASKEGHFRPGLMLAGQHFTEVEEWESAASAYNAADSAAGITEVISKALGARHFKRALDICITLDPGKMCEPADQIMSRQYESDERDSAHNKGYRNRIGAPLG